MQHWHYYIIERLRDFERAISVQKTFLFYVDFKNFNILIFIFDTLSFPQTFLGCGTDIKDFNPITIFNCHFHGSCNKEEKKACRN